VWTVLVAKGPLLRSLGVERLRPAPAALVGLEDSWLRQLRRSRLFMGRGP
jgi:hypothetical protein